MDVESSIDVYFFADSGNDFHKGSIFNESALLLALLATAAFLLPLVVRHCACSIAMDTGDDEANRCCCLSTFSPSSEDEVECDPRVGDDESASFEESAPGTL